MYNNLKETCTQSQKLNEQSQKIIDELEADVRFLKEDRERLQNVANQSGEDRDKAVRDYNEILEVIKKLDEARFVMNRLMGPDGALNPNQRTTFLSGNVAEHDKLLGSLQSKNGLYGGGARQTSGLNILNNNPSKDYFNNAGIAGSGGSTLGGYDQNKVGKPIGGQGALIGDNADEDEFWY